MVQATTKVYALCDAPVEVLGYLDLAVQVGIHPPVVQCFQVLASDNPTLILGGDSWVISNKLFSILREDVSILGTAGSPYELP